MEIQSVINLRHEMREEGVIMAYNGEISDELMISLGVILRNHFEAMGDGQKKARSVFSLFVEQVQNLIWHTRGEERAAGMIVIAEDGDEVTLVCGNRVDRDKAEVLKQTLESIQGVDKETIRQLYREGLSKSGSHEGPGAGLGLLQLARQSKQPLTFAFVETSDGDVEYFLAARI
jgi:hypothetical protein